MLRLCLFVKWFYLDTIVDIWVNAKILYFVKVFECYCSHLTMKYLLYFAIFLGLVRQAPNQEWLYFEEDLEMNDDLLWYPSTFLPLSCLYGELLNKYQDMRKSSYKKK